MDDKTNPNNLKTYYVVRVDSDPRDTHAAVTLEAALDLAMADDGSTVEFCTVTASDAGAARLNGRDWRGVVR